MRELRAQGYTFEAIRQVLATVGVHVSNATVQREMARACTGPVAALAVASAQRAGHGHRSAASPPEAPGSSPPTALFPDGPCTSDMWAQALDGLTVAVRGFDSEQRQAGG
jgi:hypothetical protein